MSLDEQIEAALNGAVDAASVAVVGVVQSVLNTAVGVIGTALNAIQALVYPFVGEVSFINDVRDRLGQVSDQIGAQMSDLQREGIVNAIQSVATAADFPLDREAPFSGESLTGAVNHKLGTDIEDVTNPESVKKYLIDRAAEEVNRALGIDAFSDGESLQSPEAWADCVAALISQSIGGAGFIGPYVCSPVEVVLGAFCKTPNCNFCMGEAGELECIAKREKARRNRDKYKKKCSRSKR